MKLSITFTILLFTFYFLLSAVIFAQAAPEFLVSWRAVGYVPPDYQGKILPNKNSRVEMGFDLIAQNKIADLSRYNISWFLGSKKVASGIGLKTFSLNLNNSQNGLIRITVSNYNGSDLDHHFLLPLAEPEVIIDTKTPLETLRNQIHLALKNYLFEARPFFFNVRNLDELRFNWRINNALVSGNPQNPEFLELNLTSQGTPEESELNVSVGINNPANILELGSRAMKFVVK